MAVRDMLDDVESTLSFIDGWSTEGKRNHVRRLAEWLTTDVLEVEVVPDLVVAHLILASRYLEDQALEERDQTW